MDEEELVARVAALEMVVSLLITRLVESQGASLLDDAKTLRRRYDREANQGPLEPLSDPRFLTLSRAVGLLSEGLEANAKDLLAELYAPQELD